MQPGNPTSPGNSGMSRNGIGGGMASHPNGFVGSPPHLLPGGNNDEMRFQGTELVMLYDYKVFDRYLI